MRRGDLCCTLACEPAEDDGLDGDGCVLHGAVSAAKAALARRESSAPRPQQRMVQMENALRSSSAAAFTAAPPPSPPPSPPGEPADSSGSPDMDTEMGSSARWQLHATTGKHDVSPSLQRLLPSPHRKGCC